jgi:hypothetical protein
MRTITYFKPVRRRSLLSGAILAVLVFVTVTDAQVVNSNAPLDFGTVDTVLLTPHCPQIGNGAPLFEVKTTDGAIFKLADHRGQYVLLDFEPAYSENLQSEPVEAALEAFGTNNQVAALTVLVPPTGFYMGPDIRRHARQFPWPTADLGELPDQAQDSLRASLGLELKTDAPAVAPPGWKPPKWPVMPGVMLIGPDGKIVATNLYGFLVKAAVAKALSANPVNTNTIHAANPDSQAPSTSPAVGRPSRGISDGISAITGTILLPNGQPAAGAQVGLALGDYFFALGHAKLETDYRRSNDVVLADRDGRFLFPPIKDVGAIIAADERGYGEVAAKDFQNGSNIVLQPWARIEGVLCIGARPGSNEQVHLGLAAKGLANGLAGLDFRAFTAMTDSDGKFVFTYLPPCVCGVFHRGEGDLFTIKAGETNRITVGGTGRPIIGKLWFPATATNGAMVVWTNIAIDRINRGYEGHADSNGMFRVDDVPAGTWGFEADVLRDRDHGSGVQLLCCAGWTIVVPEMPGGRSDEPLDLGTVRPLMVHAPQIGEAPSIEVKTKDGGTFKLADHWGQYVLLDFEGYLSEHREIASVKAAWLAFGTNDLLAMLTLKVPPAGIYELGFPIDDETPWPRTDLADMPGYLKMPLEVSFGLPGPPYSNEYQVTSLPAVFLIGQDGRIVAKDLHGDAIKAAVAKALGKK